MLQIRTLVVYYSGTGNTKLAGDDIAERLSAEVEELKDTKNRQGIKGWMKSHFDAKKEEGGST